MICLIPFVQRMLGGRTGRLGLVTARDMTLLSHNERRSADDHLA